MKRSKVKAFTTEDYDSLETAISRGQKIALNRRGNEFVVVPSRLRVEGGREAIDSVHPTTGEKITIYVDEISGFEVLR
ncbi:MAG: hypothetical protein H0W69_04665 [Gemmatimonadaceae bacterium]|nr:hypothetical protein [Gemmatimonadaceae bacterium]